EIAKTTTTKLIPPYVNTAEETTTPKIARFVPIIFVIAIATERAMPVSSINLSNITQSIKTGNHTLAKSRNPHIYVSAYASNRSRPPVSATTPAAIGATQIIDQPR